MGTRRFLYSESIATPFIFVGLVLIYIENGTQNRPPNRARRSDRRKPRTVLHFRGGDRNWQICRHTTRHTQDQRGKYAAKIIKYDDDDLKFRIAELDFMKDLGMEHAGLVKLHEAYLCRKYLTLIME